MSESLGVAVLELVADTKPLIAGLEKGKAASEEMATKTAGGFKNGIQKASIAATAALGLLVVGLHKSVDAAEEDQVMSTRLASAYKAAGLNADDYTGSIDKTVQSSAALGFKSSDVKQALGSLIVATHDHTKSLQLLGVAQDIARFKGTSLEASTKTMTMAMSGSQRAIKQLGLTITPVTTAYDALKLSTKDHTSASYLNQEAQAKAIDKSKTEAEVIQLVSEKLHGQADAYANTAAGAKEKMGAELQLLEENIGHALLPALVMVSTALADVTEWLTKHSTVAKIAIGVIAGLAAGILAASIALKGMALAEDLAEAPLAIWIVGLVAVGVGLVELWKHSETFRDIVTGAFNDVRDAVHSFVTFFTEKVPTAFDDVLKWVKGHWPEIATLISGPFGPIVALATGAFGIRERLNNAWDDIKSAARSAFGDLKSIVIGIAGSIGQAVAALIKGPINAIIGAIDSLTLPTGMHIKTWHGIPDGVSVDFTQPFHIPMLAQGGIVSSPTLAMIGEAGPEAVVPLSPGKLGGTSNVINVNGVVGNPRDVAITIARTLENLSRTGTTFAINTQ